MRRFTWFALLFAAFALPTTARAASAPHAPDPLVWIARASLTLPADWDGVYTTLDTIYTCAGAFQSTSTSADTLCGGKDYNTNAPGSPITFVCNGTSDATTIDVTCTGSGEVFTNCNADYTIVTHGTRSAGSYHTVSTINISYSGTGVGCDLFPSSCMQVDSWGTRTGPAPTAYCSTPARSATWGAVKTLYR